MAVHDPVRRRDRARRPGPAAPGDVPGRRERHSPVLASTPEADIVEVGDFGFRRAAWADLALTDHWRRYLNDPASYLRHLIDP